MRRLILTMVILVGLFAFLPLCHAAVREAPNPEAEPVTIYGKDDDGNIFVQKMDSLGNDQGYNPGVGAIDINPVSQGPVDNGTIQVIDDTLDTDGEAINWTGFIGDKRDVAILIKTVETNSGCNWDFTVDLSPDNSTWVDFDIIVDHNGTDAPVSSITYDNSATDTVYLPEGLTSQYIRVNCDENTNGVCENSTPKQHAIDIFLQYQK